MNDQLITFLAFASVTVASFGFYLMWRALEWLDTRGYLSGAGARPKPSGSGPATIEVERTVQPEKCAA